MGTWVLCTWVMFGTVKAPIIPNNSVWVGHQKMEKAITLTDFGMTTGNQWKISCYRALCRPNECLWRPEFFVLFLG